MPPPPPKAFFGRDKLIEDSIGRAETLESIALIGAGGIGKTSIALTVLHDQRIKDRFGDDRRFIRCDKFSASRANFLAQLSKVVGSGIKNAEDLTPLRPFLSSKEIILFLDNVESILDPQGTDAQEIYAIVEELSRFDNICLGITSRISTVPPHCKRLIIPALSVESACDIFYAIYDNGGRSDVVSDLVKQLDFHALSITLLATTASQNMWDYDRLTEEWDAQRAQVLRTDHNQSLSATIELSLTSPTFRALGPGARELLGVVAFFPSGIDKNNFQWLFPAIPDVKSTFDRFCALSLIYRSDSFITMLAPIRDHLAPSDPKSSPLLCETRDRYFARLSVEISPDKPGFQESRWIVLEDTNVERLLDTFVSADAKTDVWDACDHFIEHLHWHKPRRTVLGQKIEALPDSHHAKPKCLFELSQLFGRMGNPTEGKRLLTHTLKLERERGNDSRVALTLSQLSDVNRWLDNYEEGIQQAKEASEIYRRLDDTTGQANSLNYLTQVLFKANQLGAAENAAFHAINLLPEKGQELSLCRSHRFLGYVYQSKGETEKAIRYFKTALSIASPFDWHDQLFWNHWALARLFRDESRFVEANTHIEEAKSHAADNAYNLGRAMDTQAKIWQRERRLEEARTEALGALEIFEKLGAAGDVKYTRNLLQSLDK